MDEELRYHLDQAAAEFERAGADPETARRQAQLAFGGIEQTKEAARDSRGGRLLDDLLADLRYGLRQIRRTPGHAASVVVILAIGVAATAVMLSLAYAYLIRPLPLPEPERLVAVLAGPSRAPQRNPPDLRPVDWAAAGAFFPDVVAWDLDGFTLVGPGNEPPEPVDGSWVSPGYFTALGLAPALGRGFGADEYRPGSNVALISNQLWRRRFGADSGVVGTTVRAHSIDRPDEVALVTIVGVMPPSDWSVHRFTDLLRPLGDDRLFSIARLPTGMPIAEAEARLTAAVRGMTSTPAEWRMSLLPLDDEQVYLIRPVIGMLALANGLLLILALASVAALLVARATSRAHELSIRRAIGASRSRLLRQLAVEHGVLLGAAVAAGLLAAPALNALVGGAVQSFGGVPVPGGLGAVRLEPPLVAATILLIVLPFAALAVWPVVARPAALSLGGRRTTMGPEATRTRRVLAALQLAVAVVLLVQGALLTSSVRAMLDTRVGFDSDRLLKSYLLFPRTLYPDGAARTAGARTVLERIRAIPGVSAAAAIDRYPFRGVPFVTIDCETCPEAGPLFADPQIASDGYPAAMGIPLVAGRWFDDRDGEGTLPVAVVSETLARQIAGPGDPLGRRIRIAAGNEPPWLTIVGVTGDVRKTYSDSLYPDVYRPLAQAPRGYLALMIRTDGNPASLAEPVRRAVAGIETSLSLSEVEPMSAVLTSRRGRTVILATAVTAMAALAVGLTGFGLYAVLGYLVRLRHKELAVRQALGATGSQLLGVLLGDLARIGGAGLALGAVAGAASWSLSRSFLVGVSVASPAVYLQAMGVVALMALAAVLGPARRAIAADPAQALRVDR